MGTWDRKPLKKAKTSEIDDLLAKLAGRPEAQKKVTWDALRAIAKELSDSSPKSLKNNLASMKALKDKNPPTGKPAEPEPVEEEPVVVGLVNAFLFFSRVIASWHHLALAFDVVHVYG